MHILAGLDQPTSGSVQIAGTEITDLGDNDLTKLRREHIGFVFQFFNLLPMLSAEENILLPLSIAGEKPDPDWYQDLIRSVGLGDRLHHRPAELSGGQQQRVAIARALVSRPSVIFADEPTGNLDSKTSGEILELLRHSVRDLGQTMVMVTHDARAAQIADGILFLADGVIVKESTGASAPEILACDGGARDRVTRFALKGILGRKLRTVLTALAIVLGVAMVSGTFVLTDSIDDAFNTIFTDVYRGTDATITGKTAFDLGDNGSVAPPFDESLLPKVKALPDTGAAVGGVGGDAQLIGTDGKAITFGGAPNLGFSIDPTQPSLNSLSLVEGRWPNDGEVVIDRSTAGKKDLKIGQEIGVQAEGPTETAAHLGLRQVRLRVLDRRRDARGVHPADGAEALRQAGQARPDSGRGEGGRHARRARRGDPEDPP